MTDSSPGGSGPVPPAPADRSRIAELFDQGADLPPDARAAWLDSLTDLAPSVRRELIALLQAHDRQGILDRPIAVTPGDDPATLEEVAGRLGPALADRYRLERVLGEGGMAVVLLARELKHDRQVVLKVLKPAVAGWLGAERFLAEIQIVARLSHPHILALIDSGVAGGVPYYVMPYVGGETLRARFNRGPLPVAECLAVLRDVAAALAYAHQHGIVHRDLKPENVLAVGAHGFLMDFGVAKLRPEGVAAVQTVEGAAIGTPRYMAPEQAAGGPIDARVDVYAWGLVAREGLLGMFSPGTDLRRFRSDAPAALQDLLESCVAEDCDRRPRDGSDLVRRLDRIELDSGPAQGGHARSLIRRLWPVGLAAAVLIWVLRFGGTRPPSIDRLPGPVAVAGLRNETDDPALDVWGRLAGDWLTQGLQETGRAQVVPWTVALEAIGRATGANPVETLRARTGAATVVTGSFYAVADRLRLQAELVDARSGKLVGTVPAVEVPRDSVQRGMQALRDRLMGALAIQTDARMAGTPGLAAHPPTYEAYLAFERGLERYDRMEYAAAASTLLDAWHADTLFFSPLVYAARALMNVGVPDRVDSLVRQLRARQTSLSGYDDLQVRYLEGVLAGDVTRALEAIRRAAALAPTGRANYNLAITALSANRPAEAVAALRALDPDRIDLSAWAPYWYNLSHGLHLLGRHEEELTAARELRRRHPDSRAGWVHEARALASLGRIDALDSLLAEAGALPPDTYWSQGAAMVTAGEELDAHGPPGRSAAYYRRARQWLSSQLARDPRQRAHRYWLGSSYYDEGRWRDAEPVFASLVADYPASIVFRGMWALTAARQGDTAAARRRLGAAPRYEPGEHTAYRARIAAVAGDPELAITHWSEALAQGVAGLVWIHAAGRADLAPLALDPRFKLLGLLPPPHPGGAGR